MRYWGDIELPDEEDLTESDALGDVRPTAAVDSITPEPATPDKE